MAEDSRCAAVINCGQLVTLAGPPRPRVRDELRNLAIIPYGAMMIRDGLIEAVGAHSDIQSQITPQYEIIDAAGRVVLPGFVDAHTHAVFAGTRIDEYELRATGATYEQIAEQGGGIRSTVRKTRAASEDELFQIAQHYRQWFLRTGTTTLEAKSGYGLSFEDELKLLRVINRLGYVPTFLGAHEIPDEYRGNTAEYERVVVEDMLPAVARARLAEYCDVFCEPTVFDVPFAREILTAAKALGLKLRVHADQLSRSGAAELAAELGAATADHLEQIDHRGIDALARAGVQPVLLPASVFTLGSNRFAPARLMIDAGLAVVLATDFNPGSSPTPSMPFVLSLASTHMRMTPAEAITAVTVNAAYSLDRGSEIGSLEAGKRADFVIHNCRDYREIAYFAGIESADSVYAHGQLVYSRSGNSPCN
ncbi:MAG TPA: imidazolonepropionase [Bryobacteraceae bacterium]|nr:imidazolonepropionase [Bryobacteraceae bacterium]